MNDDPLLEAAERVLSAAFPPEKLGTIDTDNDDAWATISELGLAYAMVPEEAGGFGASRESAWALVALCGRHALPLPVAETIVANHLLSQAGLAPCSGQVTLASGPTLEGSRTKTAVTLKGMLPRVPWGAAADVIVAPAKMDGQEFLVRLTSQHVTAVSTERNIARHPRDTLAVDGDVQWSDVASLTGAAARIESIGRAMRTNQLAGAMTTALELTVAYTGERSQFGRSLSKFQAIQQELARMAGQVAAANAAADLAAEAANDPSRGLALNASKARASEAAGQVASIAHQTHGAMGFAAEHPLALFTRAIWSWRDEFGSQGECHRAVGDIIMSQDADELWPLITAA